MYFCRGSLPWQGLKAATKKQKYDRIMEKKMTTPTELLCRDYPNEFAIYLNYSRSLRFDDKPDYNYLRKLFRDLFIREGYHYDYIFDWTVKKVCFIKKEFTKKIYSMKQNKKKLLPKLTELQKKEGSMKRNKIICFHYFLFNNERRINISHTFFQK